MKKFFLLVVVVFSFFAFSGQANATCPDGFSSMTVALPDCPGCSTLKVDICYKCDPMGPNMEVMIGNFYGACSASLLDFYLDYAQAWIFENYASICPGAWTPCPNEKGIIIKKPLCFMYYIDENNLTDILFCNDSYCSKAYTGCTDKNGNVIFTYVNNSATVVGSYCNTDVWPPAGEYLCARAVSCDNAP